MVRLSQDWKLRHVLIEMHGNNGSIDNDPPAAMRYTEAKLSQLSEELVRDINKETVSLYQTMMTQHLNLWCYRQDFQIY